MEEENTMLRFSSKEVRAHLARNKHITRTQAGANQRQEAFSSSSPQNKDM